MKKVFRPASRLVIIKDEKILLCKMGKIWGLPGGGIDWGENIKDALERESIEELGIKAEFKQIIFIQDFMMIWEDRQQHNHALEYFCTIQNNEDFSDVVETYHNSSHAHELQGLEWFDFHEIPKTMRPENFPPVLEKYLKNKDNFSCEYVNGIE
ncbi:MAG: NUDIX domain-containing protein [Candidatus Gracilibacteria bacterium]|nr:NUDIX domain-containing protein [Candidatus Gracilibacteria bacterium]